MRAYDYAKAVAEIEAAGLSPDALAVALGGLNESQLRTGRRHLLVAQYIEQALAEGRTLAYATETAATLYGFSDARSPERIWERHVQRKRAVLVSTTENTPKLTVPKPRKHWQYRRHQEGAHS